NLLKFEDTKFLDHYMVGLTVDRTIWRMKSYPLSLQIEGLFAVQFGKDDLFEFALAPRLTWSGFPWNNYVYTRFRAAPIGLSITSSKSKLEKDGDGENLLYYVFFEVALSPPHSKENEFFVRLHHRCAFFDTINDDINGEDFLLFGFRRNF
ncbi:hypothetical protein LJC71_11515, partial [Desulfosarcina sp. OttesenSCG-928-A07]|nr:hypothetical protein [Desulfosarcina sp. OttesenSCG-928-A07]